MACASCDSAEKSLHRAEQALRIGEYAEAADAYKTAYRLTPATNKTERGRIAFLMANATAATVISARALAAYRNAVRFKYADSTLLREAGAMMLLNGDYKNATTAFKDYLAAHPEDQIAQRALEGAQNASALRTKGSLYTVKPATLFNNNRSDSRTGVLNEGKDRQLYFTTTRTTTQGNQLSGITGLKNGDIYVANVDEKGNWKRPEAIAAVNTADDEGAVCFSPDGKTMYLTVCPTHPQYPRPARIYTSARADASWSKPQPLELLSDTLSNMAHPAISPDGRLALFCFRHAGWGRGDRFVARRTQGEQSRAYCRKPRTPNQYTGTRNVSHLRPDGTLYFSSDGRGGMGGLDLFRATQDTISGRWTVEALPPPINSQGNDFGMTFDGLHNRGYFASSRSTGGRGWDKIYEFSYPENLLTVKGWVYEQDGYELPAAQVQMIGSDGTNLKLPVKPDGSFEQAVSPGVDYVFLASCRGYLNAPNRLHADSIYEAHQYVLQFPLPSMNIPVLVRNVFYAFDSAEITPESSTALDRLANLLKENPHITIELAAHTDYRGADAYNLQLSQRRAESVVRYLTAKGIAADRLSPKGYGEATPKIVNKKLLETHPYLHEGDNAV